MVFSMLSSLVKPRVVVGGGSLLRIGSSMKKRTVLSILSASSSSLSSSSLISSYDQDHSSSSFPRNTYGLAALGLLIGGINNHANDNNHTTYMAPSDESSDRASFISSELIGSAAKIYRNSAPQQCTYGEALAYAGIPRDYANTEACKLRLTREIGIINAHDGLPQFESTKEVFIARYKTIFDSIPLSVSIANKHGRLLKMLGLPELPAGSILVGGKKEFLPSIYIINSRSGRKTASAIAQHLGRWTKKRMDSSAAAAATAASAANASSFATVSLTASSVNITQQQEAVSPITVDTNLQTSFAQLSVSSSLSASASALASTSALASQSPSPSPSVLAPVSLLTSASESNSFEPSSVSVSVSASSPASAYLFESSPFLADLVRQSDNFVAGDDDNDLDSLESGPLIEPSTRKKISNASQSITSLSSVGVTRNTTHQEQAERQEHERQKSNKILMHKIGSLLWKGYSDGETDLSRFDTADKCAGLMNRLFGYRGVSGYQLSNAVNKKEAGLPPPDRGRPSILSNKIFDLLCRFFLARDAINQSNGVQHNDRSKNISLLGRIVNGARERNGEKKLDEIWLYGRILQANSLIQEQVVPDTRESHRHFWLTHHNQNLNHEKWEEATVRLGISRLPVNDEEKEKEGHVVFEIDGKDTRKNVIFFDETAIFLDASESSAGRRGSKTSHMAIPNVGKAGSKSSDKFTLLTAVNAKFELLPFLTIIPSKAKPGNRKINPGMIMGYQQLRGKYGCLQPQTHSCTFASTEKGGMSNEVFHNWVTEQLPMYYPGTCEKDGEGMIGKVDSGTGRNHIESLAGMMVNSMHLFAGTPNGTEANQEIDQLFSAFKAAMYSNRDTLFEYLVKINGQKARLTVSDMGYIIFGGRREFKENRFRITHIDLPNATERMSREHIRAACEKVGYCPATRASLNHRLVRHQQIYKQDTEGNLTKDEEADPLSYLLDELESELHDVISLLVEEGMTEAEDATVSVDRVVLKTDDDGQVVRTVPNTREHQDALQNYHYAGDFFRITNGGDVLTSPDMIIAMERKRSGKVIKELEKEKDAKLNYQEVIVPNAKKVFAKKFPWRHGVDYKAAILYGQGPLPKEKVKMGQKPDVLKEIYKNKFFGKSRGLSRKELYHTRAAETKLELMKSGELVNHTETAIWNGAMNTQTNFLQTKWRNIPFKQSKEVLRRICSPHDDFPLSANQKKEMADICLGIEVQLDDNDDDDSSIDDEESLTELLSDDDDRVGDDDDDDDRVGDGNGGDNNSNNNTTTKKKKKATSNSDDDASFREEDSIASRDSLNLYDGPTDDEEEGEDNARTTRRKKNTNTNTNPRPTRRTCTRTPIIDGEDDEEEDDQSHSDGSGCRTGTRRTGTRRGASSLIADLKKEKEESEEQDTFEQELLNMDAVLKKAKKCVEEGGNLTIPFLKALIKSKGLDPPEGRKAALIVAWKKVKDDADWKRTAFFSEQNKIELQVLEEDDSEDEE